MSTQPEKLKVSTTAHEDTVTVQLAGEIDLRTSPDLRDELLRLLERKPPRIILDLAGVSYIDSSGVGTIVELKRKAMRRSSKVVLVALQPRVRSLLEITRLISFFDIAADLDEARRL